MEGVSDEVEVVHGLSEGAHTSSVALRYPNDPHQSVLLDHSQLVYRSQDHVISMLVLGDDLLSYILDDVIDLYLG